MSTSTTQGPDLLVIKQRQQATWAMGDFSVIASRVFLAAEQLCESADLQAGFARFMASRHDGSVSPAAGTSRHSGCAVQNRRLT